jgi:hypothetical protein
MRDGLCKRRESTELMAVARAGGSGVRRTKEPA